MQETGFKHRGSRCCWRSSSLFGSSTCWDENLRKEPTKVMHLKGRRNKRFLTVNVISRRNLSNTHISTPYIILSRNPYLFWARRTCERSVSGSGSCSRSPRSPCTRTRGIAWRFRRRRSVSPDHHNLNLLDLRDSDRRLQEWGLKPQSTPLLDIKTHRNTWLIHYEL